MLQQVTGQTYKPNINSLICLYFMQLIDLSINPNITIPDRVSQFRTAITQFRTVSPLNLALTKTYKRLHLV